MKKVFFAAAFGLFGCVNAPQSMTEIEYPEALVNARNNIERKNYTVAEEQIKNYLSNPNDINWYGQAYLLLGEGREAAGKPAEAVEAYKQAVSLGAGYDERVMVQALYHISWVYEHEEHYKDLLIVLGDLQKNLSDSDAFVRDVETPARMANTYFVLGNWEKALQLRNSVAVRPNPKAPNSMYASQLYRNFAGLKAADPDAIYKDISPEDLLSLVQKDLLDVGEMSATPTSYKAFSVLTKKYTSIWAALKPQKKFSNQNDQLNYNRGKLERLAKFMDQIQEIKAARRPMELVVNKTPTTDFYRDLGAVEKEVRQASQNLEIGLQKIKAKKEH